MVTDAERANEAIDRQAQAQANASEEGGLKREANEPTRELLDASAARVRDAKAAVSGAQAELELAREQYAWDQLPLVEKERQIQVQKDLDEQAERDRVTPENLEEKMAASHPTLEQSKVVQEPGVPFRAYDAEYNNAKTRRTVNVRVIGRENSNQLRVRYENGFEEVVPANEVQEGGVPRGIGAGAIGPPGV